MRQRVPAFSRYWVRLVVLAALVLPASASRGQQAVSPSFERISAAPATAAVSSALNTLLEKGRALELSGRWGDALTHYEEALREFPDERALQARFDLARLHYSLKQRYEDRSFRESIRTFRPAQAQELYGDLLSKIEAHYYTTPPWQDISRRGAQAMDIALADENFLRSHGIRVRGQQVEALRAELLQLPDRYRIGSARDSVAIAAQAARIAQQRVGLSETATFLEFTAAGASGLDHYSAYLTADQLRDIYSQIEGNFVGLGVELKSDDSGLVILRVIRRSPAEQAGIRPGDRITAIDGKLLSGMSTDEAATLLTGVEGSVVHVTVATPGQSSRDLSVRRASVEVPSLEDVKIVDPESGVAYLRIPAFQKATAADLEAALWDLHRQGMRSLVIDLRGNPGGLLTSAVEVADKFVAEGGIVSTRGRSPQENFSYRARRAGTWRVPLVVLIDGDSASASEIFAAAIQDAGRGKIVGGRSYGKGSVQGIFPLGRSGAGARLTTARFYSPLGHPISNVGVTPDIDVRPTTLVAGGEDGALNAAHVAAFRGSDGRLGRSATNIQAATGDSPAADHTVAFAEQDLALKIAVDIVRQEPVAAL